MFIDWTVIEFYWMFISKHCFKRETKISWIENNSVLSYTFSWGQIFLLSSVDTPNAWEIAFSINHLLCLPLSFWSSEWQAFSSQLCKTCLCRSGLSVQILQILSPWPVPVPKLIYFPTIGKWSTKVWISVRSTHHIDVHGIWNLQICTGVITKDSLFDDNWEFLLVIFTCK